MTVIRQVTGRPIFAVRDRDHIGIAAPWTLILAKAGSPLGSNEPYPELVEVVTQYVFKAIDIGVSLVFLAFCVKAFLTHLNKDVQRRRPNKGFRPIRIGLR